MKKSLVFLLILIGIISITGCASPEEKAIKVANEYLEDFYSASPTTYDDEINPKIIMSYADTIDANTVNAFRGTIRQYLVDKFGDNLSESYSTWNVMIVHAYAYTPKAAKNENANISPTKIELKRIESEHEDFFFNFNLEVKIDYIEGKEDIYETIIGQVWITHEDGKYKVTGVRYFSDGLGKYR